jgi:acylphosphatase
MLFSRKKPKSVSYHGYVSGRVQSVAFRFYTRQEATQLRLTGWVQNLSDGRVEFHVQGPESDVDEFLQWLRQGSPLAIVRDVSFDSADVESVTEFEIR